MNRKILDKIAYLAGDSDVIEAMTDLPSKEPFDQQIKEFLYEVSKALMKDPRSRQYSDVITFAFWIRKASIEKLEKDSRLKDGRFRLGRGVAFHIAPSNVPVNFAYSLAVGLLTGNSNIVRVPSKEFLQIQIIVDGWISALEKHQQFKPYIALIKYSHDPDINDELSSIADTRIIWGGDDTIAKIRKSPLPPRSAEITFADRYSLAVIDAKAYLTCEDKEKAASDFYNDTYFSDQNACTSPRIVVWIGDRKEEAKKEFWEQLHELVLKKYVFRDIQGVNKLTNTYLAAAGYESVKVVAHSDNLIVRLSVDRLDRRLLNFLGNSGFFYEYDCDDVMELREIFNDKRCQTVGIFGDKDWLKPLFQTGIKGVDRIAPIGHTMDFGLIWDGMDLVSLLTRIVCG